MAVAGDMALPPGAKAMRLIESEYEIQPGQEFYQCQRLTLPANANIVRITPVSPEGVHHEVFAIDPTPAADGKSAPDADDCRPVGFNWVTLFASGLGSPSLSMPPNVALKIDAGQQIVLNLHLYNASTTDVLKGTAAIEVALVEDATGYEFAGVPFVGPATGSVPQSAQLSGDCTVSNDTNYFAVFPHMHKTGKHMKVVAGTTTVWDADYNFEDQKFGFHPNWLGPPVVPLKKGDKISVTCQYTPEGAGKKLGDSTDEEMCFAISYVYPKITTAFGSPICSPF